MSSEEVDFLSVEDLHALVDGNKRLAWSATRIFCLLNGRDLTYSVDDAEELVLSAAASRPQLPGAAHPLTAPGPPSVGLRRMGPGAQQICTIQ